MFKRICAGAVLAATAGFFSLSAQAAVVYSNNFDSPATVAAGVTSSFTGGGGLQATTPTYSPTYGQIYRSESTSVQTLLSLSNLPAHTSVDVDFLMAFLDSWDSNNGTPAPDNLDLYIDGVKLATYTFNSASGTNVAYGGGTLLAQGVQFDANIYYTDAIVDMSSDAGLSFTHTSSSLTVGWIASGNGWQGGTDEAYGIDNLVVSVDSTAQVPEPATAWLIAGGLLLLAARRRS
jgi:PEP-CTERM motif